MTERTAINKNSRMGIFFTITLLISSFNWSCTNSENPTGKAAPSEDPAPTQELAPADNQFESKVDTIPEDWSALTDEQWKDLLTPDEFNVLRRKGTERAFSGDLLNNNEQGIYTCAGCGLPLFPSNTKFKSGTGWPSYYAPIDMRNVRLEKDESFGMIRTEVLCNRCGGHLGHVFKDGPKPTGLRYCINSVSLDFVERDSSKMEN